MTENIMKYETVIYDLVNEYLNSNRFLELASVIPYIDARLSKSPIKLNKNGILTLIQSLLEKNLIVEGSRLTKEAILLNNKRQQIYNYILRSPGTYYYKTMKDLNLSSHVVIWHLNMLLDFKFISKGTVDNHEIYYASNVSFEKAKLCYFVAHEKCKRIIQHLESNKPGTSKTQLSNVLGMHINTIKKYLSTLVNVGLVSKVKSDKKVVYTLNQKLYQDLVLLNPSLLMSSSLEKTKSKKENQEINVISIESPEDIEKEEEIEKTKEELTIQEKTILCQVHKGPIEGINYICPKCKATYCLKCATLLAEKKESCWVCEQSINI